MTLDQACNLFIDLRAHKVLSTKHAGGLLIECGADSFITKQPWGLEVCYGLGLADEIIAANFTNRRAKLSFAQLARVLRVTGAP